MAKRDDQILGMNWKIAFIIVAIVAIVALILAITGYFPNSSIGLSAIHRSDIVWNHCGTGEIDSHAQICGDVWTACIDGCAPGDTRCTEGCRAVLKACCSSPSIG